jgi:S-adenosylmethionine-diacylglycerol 3-amino-3-carboxypropyl transferase
MGAAELRGAGAPAQGASIRERAAFDFIRYANVWEDADVLCTALAPAARGGRLLSIASAGDNALALLTLDPSEVIAVDLSAAQCACLELRIVAFRGLDDAALLAFLGVTPSGARLESYRALRRGLTEGAARFWDAHPEFIARGVIHAGKFERYFHLFRGWLLPLVHSPGSIRALCAPKSLDQQLRFYEEKWNTWRWRALFRIFFSRAVMGRLGRDPEFFAQVEGAVGERILERSRHALTAIPVASNPFFTYIVTGNFNAGALPRYLRPEHTSVIRARLDRLRVAQASVDEAQGTFDGFNLSDIFEYMSPAEHERCYGRLQQRARPGARLAYWNMLAPRERPASLASRVKPLEGLAGELHARDRAWFYSRFHVDEVIGGAAA